jgi:hypothetical protein
LKMLTKQSLSKSKKRLRLESKKHLS